MIELDTMSLQVIPASLSQRLTLDVIWLLFGYVSLSDPLEGLMSVSQVSRRWRQIALNSPVLWRNITIRLRNSSRQHLLASAYFKRSHNVPVSLTIHATRSFEPWEKELLRPHAHRIHFLCINVSEGYMANLLWMEMDMPMPNLETFESVISDYSRIRINRNIATIDENVNIIPPVYYDSLVSWELWNPTGVTALTLDTTGLWNKPHMDDIYHILSTISHTIQHFEYKGLIAFLDDTEVGTWSRLEFPELRSLAVLCHDNMVPLLQLMIIPALDSLTLRDFMVYPSTISADPAVDLMDVDDLITHTFDQDGLFRVIKEWTLITDLSIYGIDDISLPTELLAYIKSLNQLSSLVLYGIGAATFIAYNLFSHDEAEEPLLPNLSCFLLAVDEMSQNNDLSHYLLARQRHQLPRLQKLSINLGYAQHLSDLNRIDILRHNSNNIFVVADPEVGKFIPIKEVNLNLLEKLPQRE